MASTAVYQHVATDDFWPTSKKKKCSRLKVLPCGVLESAKYTQCDSIPAGVYASKGGCCSRFSARHRKGRGARAGGVVFVLLGCSLSGVVMR